MERADRIAFVFDRVYPAGVGGAERFYWTLARAAARSRPVSYISAPPPAGRDPAGEWKGVELVGVGARAPRQGLIWPKAAFALGLFWHLLRHGSRYRVVHCCCFPHVAVIAAQLGLLPHRRTGLLIDWFELLPLDTWRRRRGWLGFVGYALQALAVRAGDGAITFSRLHQARLRRVRADTELLPAFLPDGSAPAAATAERHNRIVFAGRLVDEKRAELVPLVLRELRRRDDSWQAVIFGDGPSADAIRDAAARAGVDGALELRGFADWRELSDALSTSRALVFPSAREGFGLVVVEAAAHGLPSVLVAGPDNAATELIEPGRNGLVCAGPDPTEIAEAVLSLAGEEDIHARTRDWFQDASRRLSVAATLDGLDVLHGRIAP
jgi:glycosyltransferase involved in cell wall biosynthesis